MAGVDLVNLGSGEKIGLGVNSELCPIGTQFQANGSSVPCDILNEAESQPHYIRKTAELAVARMRQLALSPFL
jgi:hypothetical protein